MANDFYNAGGVPGQGSGITSPNMRAEFAAIQAGFAKLPNLTGNAYKIVYVNASGSALDAIGGNGLMKLSLTGVPSIAVAGTDYQAPLTAGTDYLAPGYVHAATTKATPDDADEVGVQDSGAAYSQKKTTIGAIKAVFKTYFDGVYTTASAVSTFVSGLIGSSIQAYDAFTAKLNAVQVWTKQQRPFYTNNDTISATGTFTYDASTKGQVCLVTLTNAITMTFGAPANIVEGSPYTLLLKAGDTSARSFAWNTAFKFPSGTPTITSGSATTGGIDRLDFIGGPSNTLIAPGADVR